MLSKAQAEFKNYQLALYIFSYASFLEVMLLENFDSSYLDSVAQKIEDYAFQYRDLYTKSYDQIESFAKSSVETNLLKGLASVNKAAEKVPVINKSQIDETLMKRGERLGKFSSKNAKKTMDQFKTNQSSGALLFADNIKMVNSIYNQPMEHSYLMRKIYTFVLQRVPKLSEINSLGICIGQ